MAYTFETTLEIRAPRELVFKEITTPENYRHWMPGYVDVEVLTNTVFGQGSRWKETRKMMGREAFEVLEVTRLVEGREIDLYVDGSLGTTGKGEFFFYYNLNDTPAGCILKMKAQIEMPGLFAALLMRILGRMFVKAVEKDNLALAAWCEKTHSG